MSLPAIYTDERGLETVPLLAALTEYQKKGVGVDMVLKTVLNIARLCMLFSSDAAEKKKFFNLADTIIECRMLCNFGRPSMTLRQGLKMASRKNMMGYWQWIFTCLSFFLRVPEQFSGDLNFLQKVVFHSWSRKRFSFFYRFFKSWSLTCGLLTEITRRPLLRAALREAITPHDRLHAEMEIRVSDALMVRTLCDMYVYFKWIPGYTPIKLLEYVCGLTSGLIGVWLVWKDTRYVKPSFGAVLEVRECSVGNNGLQRAVCVLSSEGGASADDS